MEVLSPVKAKWFNLGMHLNLSENFLDETQTNIETDVECLNEMMKNWLQYHEPNMEVLNYALSQIDHPPIAFDTSVQGKGIYRGVHVQYAPKKSSHYATVVWSYVSTVRSVE